MSSAAAMALRSGVSSVDVKAGRTASQRADVTGKSWDELEPRMDGSKDDEKEWWSDQWLVEGLADHLAERKDCCVGRVTAVMWDE